jgi:hypothetical protein
MLRFASANVLQIFVFAKKIAKKITLTCKKVYFAPLFSPIWASIPIFITIFVEIEHLKTTNYG